MLKAISQWPRADTPKSLAPAAAVAGHDNLAPAAAVAGHDNLAPAAAVAGHVSERNIKQKAAWAVKPALSLALSLLILAESGIVFGFFTHPAHADESAEALPDIEAKTRQLRVNKSSTSNRVYLLEFALPEGPTVVGNGSAPPVVDVSNETSPSTDITEKPPINKILLLRSGGDNVMALRVLRDIAGTNQVIAKRIKQYPAYPALTLGAEYQAIEKISDLIPPPPTAEDKADMTEVLPEPPAYDPDLDLGTSPTPDDDSEDGEDKDASLGRAIEEKTTHFEQHKHWVGLVAGMLRANPTGDPMVNFYYTGAGLRYGYDFSNHVFVTRDDRLDTLTFEAAAYMYTVGGVVNAGDSYTVLPITLTTRYTYFYNEDFGVFAYGGFMKNSVMASTSGNDAVISNLSALGPALGVGGILRVGPQWYVRVDGGLDVFSANLMIRF